MLEQRMAEHGYLEGRKMATAFNMLRSNDLIWPYVINNYLRGKAPLPFDLLYWNSDATRMPAANHSFYLRNCYLNNALTKGEMTIADVKLDLRKVTVPIYNLATREDHIAPAKSVFLGSKFFGGPVRFVLSGSGHIAGVVNPPEQGKYQYWTGGKAGTGTLEAWLKKAKEHPGSWWPDWLDWIKVAGRRRGAGARAGRRQAHADRGRARALCQGPQLGVDFPEAAPARRGPHREAAMTADDESSRREFLGALGAGVAAAGSLAAASEATAQGARSLEDRRLPQSLHGSVLDADQPRQRAAGGAAGVGKDQRATCKAKARCWLRSRSAGIAARVINTPTAFIEDADGKAAAGRARSASTTRWRSLCAKHPGKLYGLATVDAFCGDPARANSRVPSRSCGCAACSSRVPESDLLLGDKETRPTLAAAADARRAGVRASADRPELHKRFSRTGRIGLRLARGTINSAALINMLEGGAFDEAPKLQMVVTTLAFGGLLLAGGFGDGSRIRSDAPALTRRHVYVDTMGLNPAVVRAAVDLLGADHVLMGTDWPIVEEKSVPERLAKALAHSGLKPAEQQMVAGGNALRLLGVVVTAQLTGTARPARAPSSRDSRASGSCSAPPGRTRPSPGCRAPR